MGGCEYVFGTCIHLVVNMDVIMIIFQMKLGSIILVMNQFPRQNHKIYVS